ncbi:FAD-dependent monooxygenase [Cellulomonas sp.]|uniref:FAD-dependent monooxygenase n=1 Tax=Cellulomonas sp. TaxID=40001 RepID=UPI003BA97CA8
MSAQAAPTDGPSVDVLVVGAGPTGLAMAAFLVAEGASVRLVDRLPDRVHESRALAIQPRTLEVLARLGVSDELVARGNRGAHLVMHFPRRTVEANLFALGLEDTAYPYLLFLSQAVTEDVVGAHLAARGVTVERRVELVGLGQEADGVVCTLAGPEGTLDEVRARFVVGCDGQRSAVRQLAGIRFGGSAYPQTFVLADLEADGITPGSAHAFVSPHGLLFFFPLGHPSTWRMLAMRPPGETGPLDEAPTLADVQVLCDTYTGGDVWLHSPEWTTRFRIHHRRAEHYRAGRVFVAGDAAHVHSPAGAQGMNTGIQDAANLAWKLAAVSRGHAPDALLDTYETERAPVGREVLRFTDRAFRIATSTSASIRFARGRVAPILVPLALRLAFARSRGVRLVTELDIRYRGSPLSVDGPDAPRHGVRAGDRVPDGRVVLDGHPTTLHGVLGAPGFHLLLIGASGVWAEGSVSALAGRIAVHRLSGDARPGVLVDVDGAVRRLLGASGRAMHMLVRPDGYLAYRGGADLTGVEDWLRSNGPQLRDVGPLSGCT